MKTHKVIDLVYHEDEDNEAFVGTHKECLDFIGEQPDYFTYKCVPLSRYELKIHNNENVGS